MVTAAVCRAFGAPLSIEEIAVAGPGPGQVKVAVEACAICHSDIHYLDGAWGGDLPAVFGHEAAGVVAAVGSGVGHVRPGDRVVVSLIRSCGRCAWCARGMPVACAGSFASDAISPLTDAAGQPLGHGMHTAAFAEQAVVDASQVVPIPNDIAMTSAALLGCGVITGVGAVITTARVEPGSHVVVVGCGGVGLNVVQGAVLAGARSIVAVDVVAEQLGAATELGATATVPATDDGIDVVARVRALTGGTGADYVFVAVGSKAAIEQALPMLAPGGALVLVGMPATGVTVAIDPTELASKGQRILGSKMGSGRLPVDIPVLVDLHRAGRLRLDELVSATYPIHEIDRAVAAVRDGGVRRNVITFQ